MSSRSLNKVFLIGNLTRDVELKYTAQGTAVATFGLATNRSWVGSDGQRQEDATFHRVVAWSKLAEICNQLLFKGRKVFIEGRIQTRKWTSQDGQEREVTEIVAENMVILDNRQQPSNNAGRNLDEEVVVANDDLGGGEEVIKLEEAEEKQEVDGTKEKKSTKKKEEEKKEDKQEEKQEEKKEEEVVEIDEIPF